MCEVGNTENNRILTEFEIFFGFKKILSFFSTFREELFDFLAITKALHARYARYSGRYFLLI